MTLPPLATAADLAAALQRQLDPAQADLAIRRASARVRRFTGQTLSFVSQETAELEGGTQTLQLPQRPLVLDGQNPLTVVELADFSGIEYQAVQDRDYTRIGNELTRGYPWYGQRTRLGGWPFNRTLGVWTMRVRVTYSHGYAEVPDDIADVVLDLASMNLTNPQNLRQEAIDDYSRTFASETIGNAQLSRDHKLALRPYKRTAHSVRPMS
ncbi:hypothetical protein ACFC26_09680 [Kitasatospora purpeofusca]|uniref:hypothetical protein n=1 Tax=Kitasatospora purpeofusca TaxID=67352 RepID=UPI0035DC0FA4